MLSKRPPNYSELDEESKREIDERIHRLQSQNEWGYEEGKTPYTIKRKKGEVGGFQMKGKYKVRCRNCGAVSWRRYNELFMCGYCGAADQWDRVYD